MIRKLFSGALLLLFFVGVAQAEIQSVLDIVPSGAVGLLHVPSLRALNDEVDQLVAQLVQDNPPQNLVPRALGRFVGAGFQSIDELEEIGLALDQDFSIFWSTPRYQKIAAVVHVADRGSIEDVLKQYASVGEPKEYQGIPYEVTDEGSVLFIEDLMVFSAEELVCRQVIDVYKGNAASILKDEKFRGLKVDEGDLTLYAALDQVAAAYGPMLSVLADGFSEKVQAELENAETPTMAREMLQAEIDLGLWLLQQMKALGISLSIDETDVELLTRTRFVESSPLNEWLGKTKPRRLSLLEEVPSNSFIVGGMVYDTEQWLQMSEALMKGFAQFIGPENASPMNEAMQALTESSRAMAEWLGDEIAYGIRFGQTLFPDTIGVYEIDKGNSSQLLDLLRSVMPQMSGLYEALGMTNAEAWGNLKLSVAETYMGTDILGMKLPIQPPGVENVPPEARMMMPSEWDLWYAAEDDHLLYSMSSTPELLKEELDVLAGSAAAFGEWFDDTDLGERAPREVNWVIFISPVALIRSGFDVAAEMNPQVGMMSILFEGMTNKFSIIASGANRPEGQEFRLQIAAGDFRELINMITMMSQM